jgi:hypothetical protein
MAAAEKVWRYLLGTKSLALQASGYRPGIQEFVSVPESTEVVPIFFGSSDASFADVPETRRSS